MPLASKSPRSCGSCRSPVIALEFTPPGGVGVHPPRDAVRSHSPDVERQVSPDPAWFERGRAFFPMVRTALTSIEYPVSSRSQWRSSVAPRSTT